MFDPDRQQQERQDLAKALRELRRAAGLSGDRLAARCAISQSKISRIERGKVLPSVTDVQRILVALDVGGDEAKPLLDLARSANVHYRSWRSYAEVGLWRRQAEFAALDRSAVLTRHFTPATPSGLLQTSAFATEILTPRLKGRPARDVQRAVEARLARQDALQDTSRTFVFVMTEQTVRWQRASSAIMSAQCVHMASLAERSNITMALVPNHTLVDAPPLSSFSVYDEQFVLVEMFSGEIMLRDPRDVEYHITIVNHFLERALVGSATADFLREIADEF